MLTLRQLMSKTPTEVRIRAQACGHTLESEQDFKPQRAKGKNPYLEQVYTAHCLDGPRQVTIRFQAGVSDKNSLVWVSCSCPFWLFTCEYSVSQVGSSSIIYCNGQPPYVRNPRYIPYLCKHLFACASRVVPKKRRDASFELLAAEDDLFGDAVHLALLVLSRADSTQENLEQDLADVVPLHTIREVLSRLRLQGWVSVQGEAYRVTPDGLRYLLSL